MTGSDALSRKAALMMSRNTVMKNAPTENLDERIQTVHAEIDELNRRWQRYGPMMPGRPGEETGAGRYDPTLFLQKNAIGIAIDQKHIELAQLKRQQAEQALAAYEASGALSAAETVQQEAETAYEDAKRAYEGASLAYADARDQLQRQQERHARLSTAVTQHAAEAKRWSDELERDRIHRSNAGGDRDEAA